MSEIVYTGHDNTFDLILQSNGVAQDLSSVTKITATFGNTLISSEDAASGDITWAQDGYDTGEIRIDAGGYSITAGTYNVYIVVYDATHTDGIVWGYVQVVVKAEVEASA